MIWLELKTVLYRIKLFYDENKSTNLLLLTMRIFAESMSGFVKLVSLSVDSKFLKNFRFSSQSKSSSHDEFPDDEF